MPVLSDEESKKAGAKKAGVVRRRARTIVVPTSKTKEAGEPAEGGVSESHEATGTSAIRRKKTVSDNVPDVTLEKRSPTGEPKIREVVMGPGAAKPAGAYQARIISRPEAGARPAKKQELTEDGYAKELAATLFKTTTEK